MSSPALSRKFRTPLVGLVCLAAAVYLAWRFREEKSGSAPREQPPSAGNLELSSRSGSRDGEEGARSLRARIVDGPGSDLAREILAGLKQDEKGEMLFQLSRDLEDRIRALDESQIKALVTLIAKDHDHGNATFKHGVAGSLLFCWLGKDGRTGTQGSDFTLGLLNSLMPENSAEAKSLVDQPLGCIAVMHPADAAAFFSAHPVIVSGFLDVAQDQVRIDLLKKMTRHPSDAFAQMETVGVQDYRKAGQEISEKAARGEGLDRALQALLEKEHSMSGDPQRAAELRAGALVGMGRSAANVGPIEMYMRFEQGGFSPDEIHTVLDAIPLQPQQEAADKALAFLETRLEPEAIDKKFPAMIDKWVEKDPDGAEQWIASLNSSPWQGPAVRNYVEFSKDLERSAQVVASLPEGALKADLQAKLAAKK